jgi:putative ABC transport system ATP-binding protein
MKQSLMKLEKVSKIYSMGDNEVKALNNVSLDIEKGEFLIILGPSGSGKSTMMHLLGCLDYPSKGTVDLENKDITKLSESDLAKIRGQKIGFIFQQFNLIQNITAIENIMLPLEFQDGLNEHEIKHRAQKMLELVDLKDRGNHYPNQLSGGQMQRVAIARALVTNPEIVLADEPTGNLDSKTGEIVIEFLQKMHKEQHKTIIIVTHDNNLVKFGSRIIRLKDGEIIKEDKK